MPDTAHDYRKRAPNCPSLEQLALYHSGRLSAEEAEIIAQHLLNCSACAAAFEPETIPDRVPSTPNPSTTPRGHLPPRIHRIVMDEPVVVSNKYRLVRKLAEGGMGVVYEAREEALQRTVALKLVRCGLLAGDAAIQRFRTEAQAVARLEHPHIVRIYDYGEFEGVPYFSMELMAGSLTDKLNGELPPEREAAQLVETLARAVQFAHEHKVLHRDLKPGNVLLAADGTVKLSDFGLAKLLDSDSAQTYSDAVLGTPSYMSPEQAGGDLKKVDVVSDVYSLGAILYELLTARPPFRGTTRAETLDMVRSVPPESPAALRPDLSPALEAICLKCLEKEPQDRYASAGQLAERLRAFLDGKPITERPPGRLTKMWRSLRRIPSQAAGVALLALGCVSVFLARAPFKVDPPPNPKPLSPRAQLVDKLKSGLTYEFTGTEPLPGPWRLWSANGDPIPATTKKDCFTVETFGTALVELTDDPACDHYRFSFEVRHDDEKEKSHIGVYFGGRDVVNADGVALQSYYSFTYCDRKSGHGFDEFKGRAKLRYCCVEPDAVNVNVPAIQIGSVIPFDAAGVDHGPGPWRKITVEVTPDGIQVTGPDPASNKAITASTKGLQDSQVYLAEVREKSQAKHAGIPVEFRHRGGLGLIVVRSAASFRNIILEPLGEKK
jgi:serine/threonine-protein kinase